MRESKHKKIPEKIDKKDCKSKLKDCYKQLAVIFYEAEKGLIRWQEYDKRNKKIWDEIRLYKSVK